MCLRPSMLCLVLIAAVVASGCAAGQPEETQPPAVQAYEVVDGSRRQPARRRYWNRQRGARVPVASGRTAPDASGSASGTLANWPSSIRGAGSGTSGGCPVQAHRRTPCSSTNTTRFGSATSARTPLCGSTPRPRPSRRTSCLVLPPMFARFSDVPVRCGGPLLLLISLWSYAPASESPQRTVTRSTHGH
jgi:hypothetical protein